jgi:hypothetical protein
MRFARWISVFTFVFLWLVPAAAQAQARVDVQLILALDASASTADQALSLQVMGHAAAFRDERLVRAIQAGAAGRIAVTVVRWSAPGFFDVTVPWTIVSDETSAAAFADKLEQKSFTTVIGSTAVGSAVFASLDHFAAAPGGDARKVIDLVSNGFSNAGPPPALARQAAEAADVTVNALVILDEYDWLEQHYSEEVIAGPSAFVVPVKDRADFVKSLLNKLIIEIVGLEAPRRG